MDVFLEGKVAILFKTYFNYTKLWFEILTVLMSNHDNFQVETDSRIRGHGYRTELASRVNPIKCDIKQIKVGVKPMKC